MIRNEVQAGKANRFVTQNGQSQDQKFPFLLFFQKISTIKNPASSEWNTFRETVLEREPESAFCFAIQAAPVHEVSCSAATLKGSTLMLGVSEFATVKFILEAFISNPEELQFIFLELVWRDKKNLRMNIAQFVEAYPRSGSGSSPLSAPLLEPLVSAQFINQK